MQPDEKIKLASDDKIRRVVLCTGKVYYDLYEEREKRGIDDVYLMRVEQLYPFPMKALVHGARALQERRTGVVPGRAAQHGRMDFVEPYLEWVLNQIERRTGARATPAARRRRRPPRV